MKGKKTTAFLLALVLLAGLLTGCVDSGTEDVALLTGMSVEQVKETYKKAKAYYNTGEYLEAAGLYGAVSGYKDSGEKAREAVDAYQEEVAGEALRLSGEGSYEDALDLLAKGAARSGQGAVLQDARETVEAALTDAYLEKAQGALSEANYDGARNWLDSIRRACGQEDSRVTTKETEIFAAQRDDYLGKAQAALDGEDFSGAQVWLDSIPQNGPADARVTEMQNSIWSSLTEDYLERSEEALAKKDYQSAAAWLDSIRQVCGTVDPRVENQAKKIQKTEILDTAAQFDAAEDMPGKLEYLRKVLEEGCSDTDVVSLYNSDYAAYKTQLLADAQAAFESQGYEAAIKVLLGGSAAVQEDKEILQKIEEYQSYQPIPLAELEYDLRKKLKDSGYTFRRQENEKDNLGNAHLDVLELVQYQEDYWQTYRLDGKYKTFSGTLFLGHLYRNTDDVAYISIYGDDVLLYEAPAITAGVDPFSFSVDISNVKSLKIQGKVEKNTGYSVHISVYMADAMLKP